MDKTLFVAVPSARGIHPHTVSCVFNLRTELEKRGWHMAFAALYRLPLDLARNELAAAYLDTKCEMILLLDDDVQIEPWTGPLPILNMINAIKAGCDIVTAPCRIRDHSGSEWAAFNIQALSGASVEEMGQVRLLECLYTGLGAVLVHRRVFDKLFREADAWDQTLIQEKAGRPNWRMFSSQVRQQKPVADIFGTTIVPASEFQPEAPPGVNVALLDDRAFSYRARAARFKIHAAIDVPTTHDGMSGCFAREMEKHMRAAGIPVDVEPPKESGEGTHMVEQAPSLVGPSGRPLR